MNEVQMQQLQELINDCMFFLLLLLLLLLLYLRSWFKLYLLMNLICIITIKLVPKLPSDQTV